MKEEQRWKNNSRLKTTRQMKIACNEWSWTCFGNFCACMHVYNVCGVVPAREWVYGESLMLRYLSQLFLQLFFYPFGRLSYWSQSLLFVLRWLSCYIQGSACLCSAGLQAWSVTCSSTRVLRIQTPVLTLAQETLYPLNHPPAKKAKFLLSVS